MKQQILFETLKSQKNILFPRIGMELLSGMLTIAAAWETAVLVDLVFMRGGGLAETAPELPVLFPLCRSPA